MTVGEGTPGNRGLWPRVGLQGARLDLDTLADIHNSRDPGIVRTTDGYFLVSSGFANLESVGPADVIEHAREVLSLMNGAARLAHGSHRNTGVDRALRELRGEFALQREPLLAREAFNAECRKRVRGCDGGAEELRTCHVIPNADGKV